MKSNPLTVAVARACADLDYRRRLLADTRTALKDVGIDVPGDIVVVVHESTEDRLLVVLPTNDAFEAAVASEAQDARTVAASGSACPELPVGDVPDVPSGLELRWRDCTLIAVGRIDEATAPAFRRSLDRAFVDIDVDLAGVAFLSSAGLSVMLAARDQLARRECALTLCNLPEEIRNVFALSGLVELFEIVDRGGPNYWHKCRTAMDLVFGVPGG